MARNNDTELGFIKPHAGLHSGILGQHASAGLGSVLQHANKSIYKGSTHGGRNGILSQSVDAGRPPSKQSHRSNRPYSRMSRASLSRYDDDTISIVNKRKISNLPKLVDKKDQNYINILTDSISITKKSTNVSKSAVSNNNTIH